MATSARGVRPLTQVPSSGSTRDHLTMGDIVAPFRRRWKQFLLFCCGLFALLGLRIMLGGPTYQSSTAFLVTRERMDPLVTPQSTNQGAVTSPPLTDEEINSEVELIKSDDLLRRVVLANGLQKPKGTSLLDLIRGKQTEADLTDRAVRGLATKLKVETPTKTNLIRVTYNSSNPSTAYGVLNSLDSFYLDKHAQVHRSPGSSSFFAQQTAHYRKALADSEARLKAYGDQGSGTNPDEIRSALALQIASAIGLMHTTEQAVAADNQRISSDRRQMASTPERSATKEDDLAADALLQQFSSTLLAAQTKRTQLALKFAPTYPLVQEADQEIAQAQAAIDAAEKTRFVNHETDRDPTYELLREDLAKARVDVTTQKASLESIREGVASLRAQIVGLSNDSLHLADLRRETRTNEDAYLLYLSKQQQEETADALDRTRIENVAVAVPAEMPVLPIHGPLYYLALAFIASIALSLALVYALDYLNPSFHSPNQIVEDLGIPVVVSINRRAS